MAYSNITLTTQTGLSFITGEFIQLIHDSNNYMFGQIVSYNPSTGSLTFTPTKVVGSGTYSTWEIIASGASGNDGTSGTSGINGTSGTSGVSGSSGVSGTSGTSGVSGSSGSSGINGTSGSSGLTGTSGTSGVDGTSGVSGTSGTSGVNGASGTSGVSGSSGSSGVNGSSGTSGTSGTSVSVSGTAGYVTYFNSPTTITGSSNLFWDSANNRLGINTATPSVSLDVSGAGTIAKLNGTTTNNAYLMFQNAGANKWQVGNLYNSGVNSFEFTDAASSTLRMSIRTSGETYQNGYLTIFNQPNFSSSGNYAINPSLNSYTPASTTFNSGASWSGMATSLLNAWGGDNTIPNGVVYAGFIGVNRSTFSNAGTTITVSQGTGARAIAGMQVLSQTGGTNNGTISHGASLLVQGVYPSGTANVTFTNYYGLLLNQLDEFGTVTFTNRWGIYQGGSSDNNYFAAPILIGTSTPAGYKLDVSGTSRITGQLTLGSTITNGTYTYTLPSATGTLALTSSLGSYVPYTGATADVNLGLFNLYAQNVFANDTSGNWLSSLTRDTFNAIGVLALKSGGYTNYLQPAISITASRTWTLPNASGTVALTSDIPSVSGTTNYISKFTGSSTLGNSNLINDSSGNLGLGVTPSAFNTYYKGFEVGAIGSGFMSKSGESNLYINTNAYYNNSGSWIYGYTDFASSYQQFQGQHKWFNAPSGTAGNTISFTQAMTLFSNGNLLLTTGTVSDAGYKLDVNGTGRFTGNVTFGGTGYFGSDVFTYNNGGIFFSGGGSYTSGIFQNASGLQLQSGGSPRLTIASTGAATFSSSVTAGGVNSTGGMEALGGYFKSYNAYLGRSSDLISGGSSSDGAVMVSGSNNLIFGIALTERMRITSGGNVLIGTTTDNGRKLQVNGDILTTGSGAGLVFADQSNNTITYSWYSSSNIYIYKSGSGNLASINASTGIYTPLSDVNKKKDFEESKIGLNAILNLKPTLYRMKGEEDTEKHLGFIAQEVQPYIPQAYVESDGFIGLNDRPIIAALVKAIQEMNETIKNQQEQINELKAK